MKSPELPPNGFDLRNLSKEERKTLLEACRKPPLTERKDYIFQRICILDVFRGTAENDEKAQEALKNDPLWIVGHPNGEWKK